MISWTSKRFRSCFERLPSDIQQRSRQAYKRWIEDRSHPGLRFNSVLPTQPIYSVHVEEIQRAIVHALESRTQFVNAIP